MLPPRKSHLLPNRSSVWQLQVSSSVLSFQEIAKFPEARWNQIVIVQTLCCLHLVLALLSLMLPFLPPLRLLVQPPSSPHPKEIWTFANNPMPIASLPTSKNWPQHLSPALRLLLKTLGCHPEWRISPLPAFPLNHLKVSLCCLEFAC